MKLPIYAHREEIVETIRKSQVTIVVGETGSGKTTQLPQFLYEACFSAGGVIGITEPRRIAATSVAEYVAKNLGTNLGDLVGYQIRHDDQVGKDTKVKFMTDGVLLREIQDDPLLSKYSVIMIDEAHERSVNIDFLLGLLKDLLKRRSDLKLVVSSATIDSDKFSSYFADAPVIEVSGRTYPVEVFWENQDYYRTDDLLMATANAVINVHSTQPAGDILVFLPGLAEINLLASEIEASGASDVVVLPAHGSMSPQEQSNIFDSYPDRRKIILATNVAETSITIEGVVYVVDSGLVKQTDFHPDMGIQSLDTVEHSKAGCQQRAGRAGRTQPGKCYRMYSELNFLRRKQYTEPELRRTSLAGVVLAMENIGIADIENFDFIDPPDRAAFVEAYETLVTLGAVDPKKGALTTVGRAMAHLPLEPRIARMVIEAQEHGCVEEVVTVAAFMSVRNVFARPRGKEFKADTAHARFKDSRSDALTFLKVWAAYQEANFGHSWCHENFLNGKTLTEVRRTRSQILNIMEGRGEITSSSNESAILKSVAAGLVQNLMQHDSRYVYRGAVRAVTAYIFPGSSVFQSYPRWVVCADVVVTSKSYARMVSMVEDRWLPEIAPSHFYFGPVELQSYDEASGQVLAHKKIYMRKFIGSVVQNVEVGVCPVELSLAQARLIQCDRIEKARAEGMLCLVFENNPEAWYLSKKATGEDGTVYTVVSSPDVRPEVGVSYFCRILPPDVAFAPDTRYANPQFRIFDFPKEVEVTEDQQEVVSISDAVIQLRQAWS